MTTFTLAALIGLCIGFMFGFGCSLAILYSIYLGGYRKAVAESLLPVKPKRYLLAIEKLKLRQVRAGSPPA